MNQGPPVETEFKRRLRERIEAGRRRVGAARVLSPPSRRRRLGICPNRRGSTLANYRNDRRATEAKAAVTSSCYQKRRRKRANVRCTSECKFAASPPALMIAVPYSDSVGRPALMFVLVFMACSFRRWQKHTACHSTPCPFTEPGSWLEGTCVWQLYLAHFGSLIWPTLSR